MKATLVFGSPRGEKGASSRLGSCFADGLRRAETEVTEIFVRDSDIRHCTGCYTCWTKTPGKCIHRDDMDRILPCLKTDLLVWVTPLYYSSVPGKLKDLIDRQLPLNEPWLIEQDNVTSHPAREKTSRTATFLIAVAGFPEQSHFDHLVSYFRRISDDYTGDILIGGAEPMSKDELQSAYEELYALVEQAGFETGKAGRISDNTRDELNGQIRQMSENAEKFRDVANDYWQSQIQDSREQKIQMAKPSGKLLKIADGGMSAFLAGMAIQYNPDAEPGTSTVIQFEFETQHYFLYIQDGECSAYSGDYPTPDLAIVSTEDMWLQISSGTIDGVKAFMEGKYTTRGDMNLLMKLDRLFGTAEAAPCIQKTGTGQIHAAKTDNTASVRKGVRGPIPLKAMTWFTVAFLPWMLLWSWGHIHNGLLPPALAAGLAIIIAVYHMGTNRITFFEGSSAVYLAFSYTVRAAGWGLFVLYHPVVDYIFLGAVWLVSVSRNFSLTAEYSRYDYPELLWKNAAFTRTNDIITSVWGLYFLLSALITLARLTGNMPEFAGMIAAYALLIPMFLFTSQFQKYYPGYLLRSTHD